MCDSSILDKTVKYDLHQDLGVNKNNGFECSIKYIHEASELSNVYFSRKNIDIIHKTIKSEVLKASGTQNYKIANQSEEALEAVMRAMYLQNSKNVPVQIGRQVKCLNKLVIEYCVNNIMININSYIGYIRDLNATPSVYVNPVCASSKSDKTELQSDVGFVNFSR